MSAVQESERDEEAPTVAAYKRLLAAILERRPSGTRQRLATALAKNRSFVSQIANPAYATPIPANHLDQIFEVCHFSAAERDEFMRIYAEVHPGKAGSGADGGPPLTVRLPDLGDARRNRQLHGLISGLVRDIAMLIDKDNGKRKRR